MRAFYLAYQKMPQAVAQIDELSIFNHNAVLIEKIKNIQNLFSENIKF